MFSSAPVPVRAFFSKAAMVTFGGAYAVLGYISQQAVNHYNWLMPEQMMDGLGLAETTPGPLIMVTQFVGYVASYLQTSDGTKLFPWSEANPGGFSLGRIGPVTEGLVIFLGGMGQTRLAS